MKPTKEELLEAAKPLIKYLNDNTHPHMSAVVTTDSVELQEMQARMKTEEFVRD